MPTNLTATNAWSTPRGVSSGDAGDPSNTNEGPQANANRTEYIYQRCLNGGDPFWVDIPIEVAGSGFGSVTLGAVGNTVTWNNISLPRFGTITGLRFAVDPVDGHGAGEPGTGIVATIRERVISTNVSTEIASLEDPNKSSAFDAYHVVTSGTLALPLDTELNTYSVWVTNEVGSGSVSAGLLYAVQVQITP